MAFSVACYTRPADLHPSAPSDRTHHVSGQEKPNVPDSGTTLFFFWPDPYKMHLCVHRMTLVREVVILLWSASSAARSIPPTSTSWSALRGNECPHHHHYHHYHTRKDEGRAITVSIGVLGTPPRLTFQARLLHNQEGANAE